MNICSDNHVIAFRICVLGLLVSAIAVGQTPNLRTDLSSNGKLVRMALHNEYDSAVEAYIVRLTQDANRDHSWQLKLEDSILKGHPAMDSAQIYLPAFTEDSAPEIAVIYRDGASAGPPDLIEQIRVVRATVLELLPGARRKVADLVNGARTPDEFLRQIESYKQQRMLGSMKRGPEAGDDISMTQLRQTAHLAIPASMANGLLWGRILEAAKMAGNAENVSAMLVRVNEALLNMQSALVQAQAH